MSDEQDLKLACLHQAGGNLDHAKALYGWVCGANEADGGRSWEDERTKLESDVKKAADALLSFMNCGGFSLPMEGESAGLCVQVVRDERAADLVRTEVVTDGDREDPITSEPETHTGNGGEEFLLDEGQRAPDESSSQASSTDAPAWQRFRASEGWHTFAGVRDYEYFTFLEGVKFEMAIVGGGRVIVTSPGPGVKLDEPVRNVEAYRIIDAKADEVGETTSELDSSSEPQAATEQEQKDESTPVLDALPPSIPRSEIPEGAAVETFTDAGVETVKIGGITRIVEDVADQGQGDASVFAHGILEETKAEPERPSLIDRILGRAVPA